MAKQVNSNLSIVIPTFNRAALLDYCLGKNIELVRSNNIQIKIFDNASTDETQKIVKKWIEEYDFIQYFCHDKNIGVDANFEFALKEPDTKYVWLLGDSYLLPKNGIEYVLEKIAVTNSCYDMMLVNVDNLCKNKPQADYTDQNLLLADLFWLSNCMSCLIFSKHLIAGASFERYRNSSFIHSGVMFDYIANKSFSIHWQPNLSVGLWRDTAEIRKNYWQSTHYLEIWVAQRTNLIFSLPVSYRLKVKLRLATETNVHSRISAVNVLSLRALNIWNLNSYKQYKYLLHVVMTLQVRILVLFVAFIPASILNVLKKTIKKVFRQLD
jgi:abequosyltransferase